MYKHKKNIKLTSPTINLLVYFQARVKEDFSQIVFFFFVLEKGLKFLIRFRPPKWLGRHWFFRVNFTKKNFEFFLYSVKYWILRVWTTLIQIRQWVRRKVVAKERKGFIKAILGLIS
ncbi:hypothetical protein Hanom_Chr05g00439701 [Helianthus anomalus]